MEAGGKIAENEHGRRIAILIGTNEYSKVEKLEFAENDAREMGEVLLDKDICGFDEVIELIDKNKEEVSQKIEKVFKNAKQDDEVLIYYSGHGKPSYNFDLCLLFKDSDPESLLATSLKFDYINECKEQSACNRVVVILDCCYSGTAGMKGDSLQEMLSSYTGSGTILLTSTGQTGSSIAKEDRELKHGVFTSYLLKGLKDWTADDDDDGIITVNDLYKYTFKETKAKGLQRPQMKGSYEGEMILGRSPQKIKRKELEEKNEKLIKYLSSAPPYVLNRSLTILQKSYENPSALEPVEVDIWPYLQSLLDGKIEIENYIKIVKYQDKFQKQKGEMQKIEEMHEREKRDREERKERKEKEILKVEKLEEQNKKSREEINETRKLEEQEKLQKDREKVERKKPEDASKVQMFSSSMKKRRKLLSKKVLTVGAIFGILLILAILYFNHYLNERSIPGNAPAIKEISADVTSGPAPLRVWFTSKTTGSPTRYFWVFEPPDDDWNSKNNTTARHTFHEPGIYTVSLTIENDAGNATLTIKDCINVTSEGNASVFPVIPVLFSSLKVPIVEDFSADVISGPAPLRVWFMSNTTGSPTSYFWVFEPPDDDWNSKNNTTARHTFHEPGTYTVSLTVENDAGNYTVTKKDYIKVN
ncbi:MAG TPA: PKD domain-containing protein [Methanosarcina sp.]|jgi:PKD repeat protein|nr:PKD domain-containing protein [Methanosarcina sp.]